MAGRGFPLRLFAGEADPIPRRLNGTGFDFRGTGGKDLADYLAAHPTPPSPANAKESAPAHAPLVPLETPFITGMRYSKAPCTEWPSRLDLYHLDPTGDTLRAHGVLILKR